MHDLSYFTVTVTPKAETFVFLTSFHSVDLNFECSLCVIVLYVALILNVRLFVNGSC